MPNYSSKSQKRSKSQSKNGGRRRKRTLKNVRRRKSRKVMMGGGTTYKDISEKMGNTWGGEFEFQFEKNFTDWVKSKNLTMDSEVDINDADLNKFAPFIKIKDSL